LIFSAVIFISISESISDRQFLPGFQVTFPTSDLDCELKSFQLWSVPTLFICCVSETCSDTTRPRWKCS